MKYDHTSFITFVLTSSISFSLSQTLVASGPNSDTESNVAEFVPKLSLGLLNFDTNGFGIELPQLAPTITRISGKLLVRAIAQAYDGDRKVICLNTGGVKAWPQVTETKYEICFNTPDCLAEAKVSAVGELLASDSAFQLKFLNDASFAHGGTSENWDFGADLHNNVVWKISGGVEPYRFKMRLVVLGELNIDKPNLGAMSWSYGVKAKTYPLADHQTNLIDIQCDYEVSCVSSSCASPFSAATLNPLGSHGIFWESFSDDLVHGTKNVQFVSDWKELVLSGDCFYNDDYFLISFNIWSIFSSMGGNSAITVTKDLRHILQIKVIEDVACP